MRLIIALMPHPRIHNIPCRLVSAYKLRRIIAVQAHQVVYNLQYRFAALYRLRHCSRQCLAAGYSPARPC